MRSCAQPRLATTSFYAISLSELPHNDYHSLVLPIYTWVNPERNIFRSLIIHEGCGHFLQCIRMCSTERLQNHTESKLLVSSLLLNIVNQWRN